MKKVIIDQKFEISTVLDSFRVMVSGKFAFMFSLQSKSYFSIKFVWCSQKIHDVI